LSNVFGLDPVTKEPVGNCPHKTPAAKNDLIKGAKVALANREHEFLIFGIFHR